MWRICIGVLTATACLSGLVVSAATEPVSKVTRSSIMERLQPQAVPFAALPASRSIGGKRCQKQGNQEEFLEAVRPDGRAIVSTSCPSSPEPNSLLQSGESVTVKGVTISVLSGGSSNRYDTVNVSTS